MTISHCIKGREEMTENIIIKPSVQKRFDSFMAHGRVLFFSAPCGFGKTAVAEALLSSREVLRLPADSAGSKLPSAEADWQILLLDDLQDMQEEQDWNALCELICACPERRFVLLSRGTPPGSLMAFQYTGLMTVLEADDLLFDAGAGGVLHAFPRTQPCSRRGADAHGTANSPSALCGQIQRRDCTDHGREAAHGEDPRQPHSRQAGREAPGGSQDRREEAAFSAGRPVKTASGRCRIYI